MSSSFLHRCRKEGGIFQLFCSCETVSVDLCDYHETSREAANVSHQPAGGKRDRDAPDSISFISFLRISWLHVDISWSLLSLPDIET